MATLVEAPPPPVITSEDGGGSDWVTLVTAKNDIDAHLLEGLLNEEGIEVRAIKDHSGPSWLMNGSDPWAPVAILVRRFQYEDSRIALAEVSYQAPAATRPIPRNSSPVLFWAAALTLGLLLTGIGFARSLNYIDHCGFTTTCDERP